MSVKPILVVDDEPMVLESLRLTLMHFDYSVDTAGSGAEALAKLNETEYALVLTDGKMPVMRGDQLALLIKSRWPGLPVILLTGFPPERKPEGVDAVVLKPFSIPELRGTISAFLSAGP
jgi:CheY-like chemotaxis protein